MILDIFHSKWKIINFTREGTRKFLLPTFEYLKVLYIYNVNFSFPFFFQTLRNSLLRGNNSSLGILQRNIHDTKIVYQFPCFHAGQNRSKFSPLLQTRVRGRLRPRKIENPHEHRLEMIQRAVIKGTNGKEFQVSAMFPRNNVCNDIAREEVRNGYFSLVLLSSRFFARSSSSRRISQSAYFTRH